ncbi:flagellar filament capping protein FliD [Pseudoduganella umbonata]|uniref:Flagellar hook-associated protein 2 n=2 Tax=Pseudoduganella umbonata TaxID=864828 RepID=A0A7W5EH19_9BURK|nr:flagellar filament capping protein FliD [Pseudoduganella umbonata]MBB3225123.1 flagellar hook-associated protein 2 [Pseudoduganella umbonata]
MATITASGGVLDVSSIVSQLMAVEQQPLAKFQQKQASYQATLSAYGSLSGAIGVFQSSLGALNKASDFNALSATPSKPEVMTASATSKAVAGNYKVNVTQLAQAQTLTTPGITSNKSAIGLGGKTTLSFQFGTVSGNYGQAGTALTGAVATNGISNGSLTINGTAIATDSTTSSARALAEAINAKSTTTGVTATATATATDGTLFKVFGDVSTTSGTYALKVGGIEIAALGENESGVTFASIDATLAGPSTALTALTNAGITFTGSVENGDLTFTRADGSNLAIEEVVTGDAQGGIGKLAGAVNAGSSVTASSGVSLSSTDASPITIAGSNPAAAGLTAGTGGTYLGGGFSQDANVASGTVTIDSTNNSLEGIRDAVNKAGLGVTATIVSDGSSTPYHLVFTSNATGANSSMKISLSGTDTDPPDAALANLLAYDPAGEQKMSQTSAAQDTKLTVNGIAVTSKSNNVGEAIQGVSLTVNQIGASTLAVSRNTAQVKTNVEAFVKAYNDLSGTLKKLTGYNADTKSAGALQGDSTAQSVQSQMRRMLTSNITGISGAFSSLSDVGIGFTKDGTLALDSTKFQKAIDTNFADIGTLFGAVGKTTDNQVAFTSSSAATKPGTYDLNITQMATQGELTTGAAVPASTTIAANTSWAVTLNDTKPSSSKNMAMVTIPAGTYTPAELAKVVQSSINGTTAFSSAGNSITASIDADGKLVVSSAKYGSTSNIALASGTGTTTDSLFGGSTAVAGLDVEGTLGGHPVTGSGQTMTGKAGTDAEGLKIEITGGTTGSRGTVSFSQGYAYQMNNLATQMLSKTGQITSRTDGINQSIKNVQKQSDAFTDKLAGIEARYRKQYAALDVMLANMQTTSNYLTQQLSALAANS